LRLYGKKINQNKNGKYTSEISSVKELLPQKLRDDQQFTVSGMRISHFIFYTGICKYVWKKAYKYASFSFIFETEAVTKFEREKAPC